MKPAGTAGMSGYLIRTRNRIVARTKQLPAAGTSRDRLICDSIASDTPGASTVMMKKTKGERIAFLRERLNSLAGQIESRGLADAYVAYLEKLSRGDVEPNIIDEIAWDVMLPSERNDKLLAHYHTIRSELLGLLKEGDQLGTVLLKWLDSPWVRVPITIGALVKAAEVLLAIAKSTGLFLRVPVSDRDLRGEVTSQ